MCQLIGVLFEFCLRSSGVCVCEMSSIRKLEQINFMLLSIIVRCVCDNFYVYGSALTWLACADYVMRME